LTFGWERDEEVQRAPYKELGEKRAGGFFFRE